MRTRIALVIPLLLLGCIKLPFGQGVESFTEHSFGPSKAKAKVAVVDIRGAMTSRASSQGALNGQAENIVARTKEQLDRAGRDRAVKAVVVRISSPGGAVYPSLAIYRELRAFRARFKKPVIAYTPDVAASGGYLAALGCEGIMADEAALVGSIGVIATMPNVTGLLSLIRVEMNTFKTGDLKDVGSPFRKMRPQDKDEVNGLLQHYFSQFKRAVARERKLSPGAVAKLATGAVFPASKARSAGYLWSPG